MDDTDLKIENVKTKFQKCKRIAHTLKLTMCNIIKPFSNTFKHQLFGKSS